MRRGCQIQSRASGLDRDHEKRNIISLLKLPDQILSFGHSHAAMQHKTGPTKYSGEKLRQRTTHRLKLREHQQLLLAFTDRLADRAKAQELTALGRIESVLIKKLIRVITELFQSHQHRQHQPLALDAIGVLQLFFDVVDELLV